MNVVQKLFDSAMGSKALTRMNFPVNALPRLTLLPRSRRNYDRETNGGQDSSIVLAALNWIMRNFPEAPLEVVQRTGQSYEVVLDHPMISLLEMPNPEYTGVELWMASLWDYVLDGNVYWAKVRARSGDVVELWWIPSHMIEPQGTETELITHYLYRPDPTQEPRRIDKEDIVHLRFGLDPKNPRKGMSQVKSILREVFTDEEAANFASSVLANLGIPGVIISPKHFDVMMGEDDVDAETIKNIYSSKFTGDRRGEPLVLTAPTDIQIVSWNPQDLDLKTLRRVPEERVSAVLGIPATVLGLGAGLDRSTFNNYFEARESAYENNILPTQRLLAASIRQKLLVDFESDVRQFRVRFDNTNVRALQEDITAKYERNTIAVQGGWMLVSEARLDANFEVNDSHRIFLRHNKFIEVRDEEVGQTVDTMQNSNNSNTDQQLADYLLSRRNGNNEQSSRLRDKILLDN